MEQNEFNEMMTTFLDTLAESKLKANDDNAIDLQAETDEEMQENMKLQRRVKVASAIFGMKVADLGQKAHLKAIGDRIEMLQSIAAFDKRALRELGDYSGQQQRAIRWSVADATRV